MDRIWLLAAICSDSVSTFQTVWATATRAVLCHEQMTSDPSWEAAGMNSAVKINFPREMRRPAGLPTFYLCGSEWVKESECLRAQSQNVPALELVHKLERTISSKDQTIRELEEQVKGLQLDLSREQQTTKEHAREVDRQIAASARWRKSNEEWVESGRQWKQEALQHRDAKRQMKKDFDHLNQYQTLFKRYNQQMLECTQHLAQLNTTGSTAASLTPVPGRPPTIPGTDKARLEPPRGTKGSTPTPSAASGPGPSSLASTSKRTSPPTGRVVGPKSVPKRKKMSGPPGLPAPSGQVGAGLPPCLAPSQGPLVSAGRGGQFDLRDKGLDLSMTLPAVTLPLRGIGRGGSLISQVGDSLLKRATSRAGCTD